MARRRHGHQAADRVLRLDARLPRRARPARLGRAPGRAQRAVEAGQVGGDGRAHRRRDAPHLRRGRRARGDRPRALEALRRRRPPASASTRPTRATPSAGRGDGAAQGGAERGSRPPGRPACGRSCADIATDQVVGSCPASARRRATPLGAPGRGSGACRASAGACPRTSSAGCRAPRARPPWREADRLAHPLGDGPAAPRRGRRPCVSATTTRPSLPRRPSTPKAMTLPARTPSTSASARSTSSGNTLRPPTMITSLMRPHTTSSPSSR